MVNESDPTSKPDYFAYNQFSARDLPIPRFGRSQVVQGGLAKPVRSIAWSCDGRRIATGSEYKGLRIWEAKATIDSAASFSLPSSSKPSPHNGHVAALAFSPIDPNVLVSGCKSSSAGGCIAIWNLTTPKEPVTAFKINGDVLHIAFHPSGRQFAVVCPRSSRDEVFFYHLTYRDAKDVWEVRSDVGMGGPAVDIGFEEINSLRFSNSGKVVCAVSNDGSINAWLYPVQERVISPEPRPLPGATEDAVEETVGSRASTPREGTPEGENKEDVVEPANEDVEMGDGEGIASQYNGDEAVPLAPNEGGKDMEMTKVDDEKAPTTANSVAPSRQPTPPPAPSQTAEQARQKATVAEAEAERRRSMQLVRLRHAVFHSASLLSLAFDPSGRFLAVGGQDALLSLFDTRDWICQRTFDVCTGAIRHLAFSFDGEFIAIGGDDNFIAVVSVFSGGTIAKLPVLGTVNSLCWHPSKNWLAWSTAAKSPVPIWHVVHQE